MTSYGLRAWFETLGRHEAFEGLLSALQATDSANLQLTGLVQTASAAYAVLLQQKTNKPVLFVADSQSAAETIHETLRAWYELAGGSVHGPAPYLLPAHDVTPVDGLSPHPDISKSRGIVLWRMAMKRASIVVAPVVSVLQRTAAEKLYRNLALRLTEGQEIYLEAIEERLEAVGYSRGEPVEMVGQYAVRGGIIDIFAPESPYPFRLEMIGDQVESIREFHRESQQSIRRKNTVTILPMSEFSAAGQGEGLLPQGWEYTSGNDDCWSRTILDLLNEGTILWYEPQALREEVEGFRERLHGAQGQTTEALSRFYLEFDQLKQLAAEHRQVEMDVLGLAQPKGFSFNICSQPTTRFLGGITKSVEEIKQQVAGGTRVLVAANSKGDLDRLADVFREYEVPYLKVTSGQSNCDMEHLDYGSDAIAILVQAPIAEGCLLTDSQLAVYGTQDIFSSSDIVPKARKIQAANDVFLQNIEDLREGDLAVHVQHGIGRYRGLKRLEVGGHEEEFMLLTYAAEAKLYVPLTRLELVQKYQGAGGPSPLLDRLGGKSWEKTKNKVKARLRDMADELLKLYAQRKLSRKFTYSPDSNWQREFEDAFIHQPTDDQETALADIKRDMESDNIMDRLVCGDVGFGKTEVAMRTAFKVIGDKKQVVVLVPTTVLAYQHLETFRQRFAAFPGEIEMLSRFRSPRQQREIIKRVRNGLVDILIGTHRLLSKDVDFQDLGLLIVDEEQRFGVRHKERLKQVRRGVDVLTLTATPIPRTLYMSLMGLRDISVIKTPPRDRLSIQTVVAEYDDHMVSSAISREVARGGQVYFIHNRVETIYEMAGRLQKALPQVRFVVGHGQMGERDLEGVMLGFMKHEFDVLVSTTIVENGLDIPLANTLIVDRADRFGMADLYQLRGRVGRSNRRAYAYLLVLKGQQLTEVARKRLAALREFSELGAGFKAAAMDLELRGAGNLLGGEQSGQVAAVGLETYTRLLEETVQRLQGSEVDKRIKTELKLRIDIQIPEDYVPEEIQRIQLYKQMAAVSDENGRNEVVNGLKDRYGPLPDAVSNLLQYSIVKHRAEALRIPLIERIGDRLRMKLLEESKVDTGKMMQFIASSDRTKLMPDGTFEWKNFDYQGGAVLTHLSRLLERLSDS